ncbi:UDP-2,4-diacetamido-2,4,6-trideoxy-beta-L-altropyranose hydrolase [Azospirillum soli]|uniref:UDP-2,4-diacetamido-2,4, 6-trideoxy-beta-L-altropyranose hydrolase n=1 Tax=Azospirillum soli TaxID=1304799 RepID=UPI001FECEB2D|nr:UDP-2,4-diacetamido-2,4,6-trideoxy-beta-L-altropyranose hydrolase [Azospirillum soli]MBP2316234.1 UDP-2,4-diacetamido-2,4,6-trideoxy-beta-L-altropyranose hydrolase [Azospirillum soli]
MRADAGPVMGAGHVMRCFAVAEALQDRGVHVHLASVNLPSTLADRIREAGIALHALAVPPGGAEDLGATAGIIDALDAAGVVVDGYHFDEGWWAGLAEICRHGRVPVLVFDDLATAPQLHANIVVNAALQASALPYRRIASDAVHLLGPAFAPLRREFRVVAQDVKEPLPARSRLFVTFGGADPLGLTTPVMETLAPRLPEGVSLSVAVGGSDPKLDGIRLAAERFGGRVELHVNCRAMAARMAEAGLAVAAAGTTTGELAAMGTPAILVVVADNQEEGARQSAQVGLCTVIDGREPDAADHIVETALRLWADADRRTAMAERLGTVVDGMGAVRIADALCAAITAR